MVPGAIIQHDAGESHPAERRRIAGSCGVCPRRAYPGRLLALASHGPDAGLATALATLGLVLAARARAADWLGLPVFLVIANLIEWMVHRNPMHRPLRPRLLYKNHAQLHHLAFTDANMVIDRTASSA